MPTAEWIFEHSVSGSLLLLALLVSLLAVAYAVWRYLPRNATGFALVGLRLLFLLSLFWVLLLPGKKSALTEIVKPRVITWPAASASTNAVGVT